ncbi:MAG: hypothetical protein ABSC46_00905 [Candidatus Limnocylindrales bacterium]|jgi:hypothetical protein
MSVALLFGFGLLFAGLEVVRASQDWGFSYDGAINGVLSQLAVTGPAALLVGAATTANILAGAVVLRLLGTPPFRSLSDLMLAGFAAAVVLDATTLFLLGSVGFFGWPELLLLHAAVAAAYLATRRRLPLMTVPVRFRVSRSAAWWLLVVAVWAGPLIIQLASPAVPFMDVLPNHVAPVEHIRVFGSFGTLTTSPSPIYGPSRLMLGYVAFLGQLTTITNLDAILADAAFALPLTILVALAARRLAGLLFGGSASFWILLTFPLTFTFMRLPDVRGTVFVFPLAAWALCMVAAELRARERPAPSPSRAPELSLVCAIGAGFLAHPLVGLVGITAVAGALILYPNRLARLLVPALGGGAILAIPQVLTMAGIAAPAWAGAAFIVAGICSAFVLSFAVAALADRFLHAPAATPAAVPGGATARGSTDWMRAVLVGSAILFLAVVARRLIAPSGDPANPSDPAGELMADFPRLFWLCLGGIALSILRLGRGWILLGCGVGAGLAAWAASGIVGHADLTEQAVHYEVPKSVEYWLPVMLALGAAGALAAIYRERRLGLLRPIAIGAFLVVAIYPLTMPLVSDVQIGEHRGAESLGLALREAEDGYWASYPDPRRIIDEPRQEVVDMLRGEETAGRLGPQTRVLHIASSFQQWVSVPIGVFTGAIETSISLQPELSIHTEGGRLLGFAQLPAELASGYGYVVLEPDGLSADVVSQTKTLLSGAGYRPVWSNSQATVYTR